MCTSSRISRPSIAGRSRGSSNARPSPSTPTPTWPTGTPCSHTAPASGIATDRAPRRAAEPRAALAGLTVAVPGELTTAFLALRLYQPAARHVAVPFDPIEDHV